MSARSSPPSHLPQRSCRQARRRWRPRPNGPTRSPGQSPAASEHLQASIKEISQQVSTSNDIAQKALDEANKTNELVSGLSGAASTIGEVVNMIKDIAEQTNLLALNATIEAARAGEAGKGFAVVALEVKELATQTAKATEQIAGQI
jgi:methyl-accepting chemotaxis protein